MYQIIYIVSNKNLLLFDYRVLLDLLFIMFDNFEIHI